MGIRWARWCAAATAATVTAIGGGVAAAEERPEAPSAMAALGDSLTRGFNSCGWLFDCTARSWSTGDSSAVNSHYSRLLRVNPDIEHRVYNDARTGADSTELESQAEAAVRQEADYVTILTGANDACADSEAEMTTVDEYRQNLERAFEVLEEGAPEAAIFVASVPDVVRLQELFGHSVDARNTWNLTGLCRTALDRADSGAAEDVDRRQRVRDRIAEYNAALDAVCSDYPGACRYDGGALNAFEYGPEHITKWDFFHLNKAGQRAVSEITYAAGYGW